MQKVIFLILLVFSGDCLNAQTKMPDRQIGLDSLLAVWQNESFTDSVRVEAYDNYIWDGFLFSKPAIAFIMADALINLGIKNNYLSAQILGLNIKGTASFYRGDYIRAIDYHARCLKANEETRNQGGIAASLNNIGAIYWKQEDLPNALKYFKRSKEITEALDNPVNLARQLANIGIIYTEQKDYSTAFEYLSRSLTIHEEQQNQRGIAATLSNLGILYDKQEKKLKALDHFTQSLKINEQIGNLNGIASSFNNIGTIYKEQGNHRKAMEYCLKAYDIAKSIGSLEGQLIGCSCLYGIYKVLGDDNKALKYHEMLNVIDDSLHIEETSNKLQQMEFQKQVLADSITTAKKKRLVQEFHEEEVRKKDRTRNIAFGLSAFFVLLASAFYGRWRFVRRSKAVLQVEKDRSENLLLNILPEEIAAELKEKGHAKARDFETVSILFTDFKGFTEASSKLSAQDLVAEINTCFKAFDGIMGMYGIEKIKTIGDAYMAAGGLPLPTDDSAKNTVLAALEMQAFITKRKTDMDAKDLPAFEMRVGIHTGPVVAGIVGVKKFQYDIWGDTVNTASRIESNGEVDKVNVSKATYDLLKDEPQFAFESRGKIEAKGKGEMEMYFVSLKEEKTA